MTLLRETGAVDVGDDENDSPFAHVPMPGAGPGPLQDGPFTYEKLVASTGRGTLRGAPRWVWTVVTVAAVIAIALSSVWLVGAVVD